MNDVLRYLLILIFIFNRISCNQETNFEITEKEDISTTTAVAASTSKSILTNKTTTNVNTNNSIIIKPSNELNKCKNTKNQCNSLPIDCMICSIDNDRNAPNCVYGETITANCTVKNYAKCIGERTFNISLICRFCYQTPDYMHVCTSNLTCRRDSPFPFYKANCTVNDKVACLGNRQFYKHVKCDWTSGYKWTTSILLSVFLGGFGADRFYLGQYREGFGKLFSFGGLGVWSLIDIVLIYTGYIGPQDGSIYI